MELGLNLPVVDPSIGPRDLRDLCGFAEELGVHEVYLGEHVVLFDAQADSYLGSSGRHVPFPPQANLPEPLTALAFLASETSRLRLATGVIVLPQRNPVYAAKQASTVDWLSDGRLDLTVGVGWSDLEFAATATPWDRRGARCDEYVAVMRELWRGHARAMEGEYYSLPECHQYPRPVQRPGPPLWFGGVSPAALRRVASVGDGWYVFDHTPTDLAARLAELDVLLAEHGRSREEIKVVLGVSRVLPRTAADVRAYAEVGVHQIVVSLPSPGDTGDTPRKVVMERWAELVLS